MYSEWFSPNFPLTMFFFHFADDRFDVFGLVVTINVSQSDLKTIWNIKKMQSSVIDLGLILVPKTQNFQIN